MMMVIQQKQANCVPWIPWFANVSQLNHFCLAGMMVQH